MTKSMKDAIAKKVTQKVQSFLDSDDEDFVVPAPKPAPQSTAVSPRPTLT